MGGAVPDLGCSEGAAFTSLLVLLLLSPPPTYPQRSAVDPSTASGQAWEDCALPPTNHREGSYFSQEAWNDGCPRQRPPGQTGRPMGGSLEEPPTRSRAAWGREREWDRQRGAEPEGSRYAGAGGKGSEEAGLQYPSRG